MCTYQTQAKCNYNLLKSGLENGFEKRKNLQKSKFEFFSIFSQILYSYISLHILIVICEFSYNLQ